MRRALPPDLFDGPTVELPSGLAADALHALAGQSDYLRRVAAWLRGCVNRPRDFRERPRWTWQTVATLAPAGWNKPLSRWTSAGCDPATTALRSIEREHTQRRIPPQPPGFMTLPAAWPLR